MKIQLSAVLLAALVLGGCAPQSDAAKQRTAVTPAANAATPAAAGSAAAADQSQTAQNTADQQAAPVKKKKCGDANTGSRLASCNGSSDMVQGASGDAMKDQFRGGSAMTGAPHN